MVKDFIRGMVTFKRLNLKDDEYIHREKYRYNFLQKCDDIFFRRDEETCVIHLLFLKGRDPHKHLLKLQDVFGYLKICLLKR